MANAVLNKILGVLGVGEEEDVVDEEMLEGNYPYDDIEEEEPVEEKKSFFGRKEAFKSFLSLIYCKAYFGRSSVHSPLSIFSIIILSFFSSSASSSNNDIPIFFILFL